jgi:geranylgeranyl diphosphate synthase, type II
VAMRDREPTLVQPRYPVWLRDEFESYLGVLRFSCDPMTSGLEEAMRYSLLSGGKRVRPVLALATARVLGVDHRRVLPLAAGIELIHTLSLIHDDLPAMDDDDVRRGRPTNHRVFGEGIAILAGDALFAEAFRLLACDLAAPPERVVAVIGVLARALGTNGMAGGQYIDLAGTATEPERLVHLQRLKTGALIDATVCCVALVADAPDPAVAAALARYAAELGLLFQLTDDILDATTGTSGRPPGSDARNRRRTAVGAGHAGFAARLADKRLASIRDVLLGAPLDPAELLGIATFVRGRA